MSNKKIDMSVFVGQDFDIEFIYPNDLPRKPLIDTLKAMREPPHDWIDSFYTPDKDYLREFEHCRPRLNHWHFNDGSMVLPDGLVVEIMYADGSKVDSMSTSTDDFKISLSHYITNFHDDAYVCLEPDCVIAVKIIGAHPDYSEDAKRLGIPVVEVS